MSHYNLYVIVIVSHRVMSCAVLVQNCTCTVYWDWVVFQFHLVLTEGAEAGFLGLLFRWGFGTLQETPSGLSGILYEPCQLRSDETGEICTNVQTDQRWVHRVPSQLRWLSGEACQCNWIWHGPRRHAVGSCSGVEFRSCTRTTFLFQNPTTCFFLKRRCPQFIHAWTWTQTVRLLKSMLTWLGIPGVLHYCFLSFYNSIIIHNS